MEGRTGNLRITMRVVVRYDFPEQQTRRARQFSDDACCTI
jgi:hypothetical protein